ncbi:MAG TPA: nuclease-related domain-containing protein, partial [Patescibacteria group bacterium]|nr:nuclease-related domain-containing protein [Patescibacteria group bacterium]
MAKVLGESGRYLSQEATKHLHSMWKWVIGCVALVGTIFGFILRGNFGWLHFSAWANAGLTLTLLLVLVGVATWTFRRLDELDVKRGRLQSGARGEKHVGAILSRLPEAFCVINDLATGHGNLDHVVVGPTGVFVIETKNWRGEISEDGKGELIQNGRPSTARHVATFV